MGDQVEIGGIEGNVERVGFRTITIVDQTAAMHTFQNREVKKIVNYSKRKALVVIEIHIKLEKKKIDKILGVFQNVLDELKKDKELGKYIHPNSALQGIQTIEKDGIITVRVTLITRTNLKFKLNRKYNYLLLKELEKQKVSLG